MGAHYSFELNSIDNYAPPPHPHPPIFLKILWRSQNIWTLKQLTHNLQVVAFAPFRLSVDLAFVDARVFRLCMVNLKQPVVPEIWRIEKD